MYDLRILWVRAHSKTKWSRIPRSGYLAKYIAMSGTIIGLQNCFCWLRETKEHRHLTLLYTDSKWSKMTINEYMAA